MPTIRLVVKAFDLKGSYNTCWFVFMEDLVVKALDLKGDYNLEEW